MNADELNRRARTYEGWLPRTVVGVLVELGHLDELCLQAAQGDWHCALAAAKVLAAGDDSDRRDEHDAALELLAPFLATGWWGATEAVAGLLDAWGRTDEAVALVEPFATSGERLAIHRLARLLVRMERHDEAFELLRPRADDWFNAQLLAEVLSGHGRDEEIEALLQDVVARTSDTVVIGALAAFLERRGRVDEAADLLRRHVFWGGMYHVNHIEQLADLLARHDRVRELRKLAAGQAGDEAAQRLARWYAAKGDPDKALRSLRKFVRNWTPSEAFVAVEILTEQGKIDEALDVVRPMALEEGADPYCAAPLYFGLLAEHGRHDEALAFIDQVARGGETPSDLLRMRAAFLRRSGRAEEAVRELKAHPRANHWWVRSITVEELLLLGRADEVVALLTPPQDQSEVVLLAETLIRQGRITEAVEMALDQRLKA